METQRAYISGIEDGFAIHPHTKCMSSVIDYFETVLFSDSVNLLCLTGFTIAMHRHDSYCIGSDSGFYLSRIHTTGLFLNIHKDRSELVPPYTMARCNERIWRRNDFAFGETKSLKSSYQWQRTIGKHGDILYSKVLCQRFLQLLMERTIVRYPLALPDLLQIPIELLQIRQQRGCY